MKYSLGMKCLLVLALCALALGDGWRTDAEALEREGELDRAIALVEKHVANEPDDAEAWRWLAQGFERLVARGRDALLLSEAAAAWDRVAEIDADHDAALSAVFDRLRFGEYARAEAGALAVAQAQRERDGQPSGRALALALRAQMGITAARRSDRAGFVAGVVRVNARLAAAREETSDDAEVIVVEAAWLASIQLGDRALATLRSAIERSPSETMLHRALLDIHVAARIEERLPAVYEELVRAHPEEAVVHWYAGLAWRIAGDLAARERRNADAARAYAVCVERMRAATILAPGFAETSLWVEMQARTASAWSALDADDMERAEAEWAAVVAEAPEYAERVDGLGRTTAQGLGRLGGRYLVRDELDASRRVSKQVAELTDLAWAWNNVAYLLREIASDTEAGGDPGAWDVARSTFVESWETYLRAAELAPDQPRIVNDAALIQIYHLQDDLDRAEIMLNRAIEVGEAQLVELGAYADESDRFPIAMAVGDAYQNLGFLYYRLRDEPLKAREYFVKSVATNSGVRRGVRASIQAIDGGREVSDRQVAGRPEQRAPRPSGGGAAMPGAPEQAQEGEPVDVSPDSRGKAPEDRGEGGQQILDETAPDIDWERSIEVALEAGVREGRPALVYHRIGGGIGPSVEYLQRHLHSDAFEAQTAGAITLLADSLRHTFVDRRRDGRLVLCPRAGGVTCGEHVRCAEEFAPLWRGSFDMVLGLESNGLFLITPDGLARATEIEDVFERYRVPESAPGSEGEIAEPEIVANLRRGSAESDVAALAHSTSLPARRALERVLFESGSNDLRATAVEAVAANPGPDNDELMRALARQHVDAELAGLALAAWQPGLGSGAPLFALQTSTSPAVRAAAARALARIGDDRCEHALIVRWLFATGSEAAAAAELSLDELASVVGG